MPNKLYFFPASNFSNRWQYLFSMVLDCEQDDRMPSIVFLFTAGFCCCYCCSFCLCVSFSSPVYHKALCTAGKELLSLTKVQVCRAVSGRAVIESYRQETNISNWGTWCAQGDICRTQPWRWSEFWYSCNEVFSLRSAYLGVQTAAVSVQRLVLFAWDQWMTRGVPQKD